MAEVEPKATIADYEQLLDVALHTLHLEFERMNRDHLHGAVQPPGFALHGGASRLGFWHPSRRVISISLDLLLGDSWDQVVDVLRHEVAHAYTREVLGAQGEPRHGPTFRHACQLLRISPRTTFRRRGREDDADGVAAMTDELKSRHLALVGLLGDAAQLEHLSLGRSFGRVPVEQYALANALHGLCGVVFIWVVVFDAKCGGWARRLQVCGWKANVQAAAQVHAALVQDIDLQWASCRYAFDWPTRREKTAFTCAYLQAVCGRYVPSPHHTNGQEVRRVEHSDLGQWFRQRHPVRFDHDESIERGGTEAWEFGFFAGGKVQIPPPLPAGSLTEKTTAPATSPRTQDVDHRAGWRTSACCR